MKRAHASTGPSLPGWHSKTVLPCAIPYLSYSGRMYGAHTQHFALTTAAGLSVNHRSVSIGSESRPTVSGLRMLGHVESRDRYVAQSFKSLLASPVTMAPDEDIRAEGGPLRSGSHLGTVTSRAVLLCAVRCVCMPVSWHGIYLL